MSKHKTWLSDRCLRQNKVSDRPRRNPFTTETRQNYQLRLIMQQYLDLVERTLQNGTYKKNRTDVDTISTFSQQYTIDLAEGFPLLTTKKMDTFRWDSLREEFVWYLTGDHHIRNLDTKIWDAWADDEGNLETAYGRFWRRYPIPDEAAQLPGEAWLEDGSPWVTVEEHDGETIRTFDQIQFIVDALNGDNPHRGPNSRRLMVTPWHPSNAAASGLPPCHAFWGVNVQDDHLNLHLTQRSGDIALGIPFNIACYSLILKVLAEQTGFKVGQFSHTILDAHIYCGNGDRGEWYENNLSTIQNMLDAPDDTGSSGQFSHVAEHIEEHAPSQDEPYDHVPGLLEQLGRQPKERPTLDVADKSLDELTAEDIQLKDYDSYDGLTFAVAE